jgi:hypothetical protein
MRKHTQASLKKALWQYAQGTKGAVTAWNFCRHSRIDHRTIKRFYQGGFRQLMRAAKLEDRMKAPIEASSSDALLAEFHRVAAVLGHLPTVEDMRRFGKFCRGTYYNRFGPMNRLRRVYEEWCRERGLKPLGPAPVGGAGAAARRRAHGPFLTGLALGQPLGFRGMQYAPTSESGVIYLFGLLGLDTGVAVEHLGSAFPDCRGSRRGRDGTWRPVAIEFELRSSNFKAHGHDPAKCDLIVCWEHDWAECPVDVMELKGVLERRVAERDGEARARAA